MKKVSVYELRGNLASYLDQVNDSGVPVVVHKFNKPIAVIIPPSKKYTDPDVKSFFGFLSGDETGTDIVNNMRRNKGESGRTARLRKGKK